MARNTKVVIKWGVPYKQAATGYVGVDVCPNRAGARTHYKDLKAGVYPTLTAVSRPFKIYVEV